MPIWLMTTTSSRPTPTTFASALDLFLTQNCASISSSVPTASLEWNPPRTRKEPILRLRIRYTPVEWPGRYRGVPRLCCLTPDKWLPTPVGGGALVTSFSLHARAVSHLAVSYRPCQPKRIREERKLVNKRHIGKGTESTLTNHFRLYDRLVVM